MISFKKCTKYTLGTIAVIGITALIVSILPHKNAVSVFPLERYSQDISTWISPSDVNFDTPLLTQEAQKKRHEIFLDHYYADLSPWNKNGINAVLEQFSLTSLAAMETTVIETFSNKKDTPIQNIGYGENFRPYSEDWIKTITNNFDVSELDNLTYNPHNRAITIDNLQARALPTNDVFFYNFTQGGQGYPFDNLQVSAVWAGTPVYILMTTKDRAWTLICTPYCIGWVKSTGIAHTTPAFIDTWSTAAKNNLAAITRTQTSMTDQNGHFLLTAYVGSVFPVNKKTDTDFELMVPVLENNHLAGIKTATIDSQSATLMPMTATPHNFSIILSTLVNRPYGWGNMYFYNDCSAELMNLFTPFGIWIPRHSSDQLIAGKMIDMSAASPEKRVEFLKQTGKPFLTIVYIGGHVFLYIGNYPDPNNPSHTIVMTYQNLWGLAPKPPVRRAIIGQSVFFPLLLSYPEDRSLKSLADKKYFQIAYLNEFPNDANLKASGVNIETLKHPGALPKDIAAWQSNSNTG